MMNMFSFFNRTPKIDLDCFTHLGSVYQYTPLVSATKAKPEWFEKVRKTESKYVNNGEGLELKYNPTLRTCYGFLELFRRGFVIENWCDLAVHSDVENYQYHYSYGEKPEYHNALQYHPGFRNYFIIKLKSPWLIKNKENTKFIMTGAEWHLEDLDIKILPGVLDFKSQSSSNIFIAFKRVKSEFLIKMGQPLAHFVPLSDKSVRIHQHLVTKDEYDSLKYDSTCSYGWRRAYNLIRRNEKRDCPFKT